MTSEKRHVDTEATLGDATARKKQNTSNPHASVSEDIPANDKQDSPVQAPPRKMTTMADPRALGPLAPPDFVNAKSLADHAAINMPQDEARSLAVSQFCPSCRRDHGLSGSVAGTITAISSTKEHQPMAPTIKKGLTKPELEKQFLAALSEIESLTLQLSRRDIDIFSLKSTINRLQDPPPTAKATTPPTTPPDSLQPLTEDEKDSCIKPDICFRCRQHGHPSFDECCPNNTCQSRAETQTPKGSKRTRTRLPRSQKQIDDITSRLDQLEERLRREPVRQSADPTSAPTPTHPLAAASTAVLH